jgi:hypothetical protein
VKYTYQTGHSKTQLTNCNTASRLKMGLPQKSKTKLPGHRIRRIFCGKYARMAARKRMQPLIRANLEQNFYKIYSLFYAQVGILAFATARFSFYAAAQTSLTAGTLIIP